MTTEMWHSRTVVTPWKQRSFDVNEYLIPQVEPQSVEVHKGMTRVTMPIPDYDENVPCRQTDPDLFFASRENNGRGVGEGFEASVAAAVAMCEGCEFLVPCREWGIAAFEYGVLGGLTAHQRHRVRKARGWHLSMTHVRLLGE